MNLFHSKEIHGHSDLRMGDEIKAQNFGDINGGNIEGISEHSSSSQQLFWFSMKLIHN